MAGVFEDPRLLPWWGVRFRASRRPVGDTRWPRSWPEWSGGKEHSGNTSALIVHTAFLPQLFSAYIWQHRPTWETWELGRAGPGISHQANPALWDVGHSLPGPRSASCLWLPCGLKGDHCHPWWWPQNFRELFTSQAVCQVLHSRAWVTVSSSLHDRPLRPASCPMLQRSKQRLSSAGHLLKVEQPVSGRAGPTAGFLWPDPASWTRLVTGWEKADWRGLGVLCLGWGPTKSPERALPPFWEWQSPQVGGGEHICFLGAS